MSMLKIIRDTAAMFDLDKELEKVRVMQLRAAHDGQSLGASELAQAEVLAIDQIKRKYYCEIARLAFMPSAQADALTDQQDYEGRQYKDSEFPIFEAHHRILSLPCVGAPEHDDPDPGISAAEGR